MHFRTTHKRNFIAGLIALMIAAIYVGVIDALTTELAPVLTLSHSVGSTEPLIGGEVSFNMTLGNTGAIPVTDKGYNVSITNTLPVSLTFVSATIEPTFIQSQSDGSTLLIWDNISDLEVNEELDLLITASLDSLITVSDVITNAVSAAFNEAPDNSGVWQTVSSEIEFNAQALDIEVAALQSTADEQATGAGEYDGSADWPYQYEITVKNNNVGPTSDVMAEIVLPAGIAYMGNPTISPNPNGSEVAPTLSLNSDGTLTMSWSLGEFDTAEYSSPVVIKFDAAIPYKYRTSADTAALIGPFSGPMSGAVITEDSVHDVSYEATGTYAGDSSPDGTTSTPDDDTAVPIVAEYLTISKSGTPATVGIGETVVFNIDYYVSEYYTVTSVIITDTLPDGMTYIDSSLFPTAVEDDTPGAGQTRIRWDVPSSQTRPGMSGSIVMTATVDATYERAPYAGEPVVSGDSLTNRADSSSSWADIIDTNRSDDGFPDSSSATVNTRMPTLTKVVKDPESNTWGELAAGFTGDTLTFKITYNQANNVDATDIVIRDFLPRGMTFVNGSDVYNNSGTFSNGIGCTASSTSPTIGELNGLQYLEWPLCNVTQGSQFEVEIDAILGPTPDIQDGWLVGNFGKLSGQNTYGDAYSLRDFASVDYDAPHLTITKTADQTNVDGGEVVNYSITVENIGTATAYQLNLLDTLPEFLELTASGGSASPAASSFTASSGAQSGSGGAATWSQISSLAPGESLVYQYSATVSVGVPSGVGLNNVASISYSNRSDSNGNLWSQTSDPADDNTDDETIYVNGLTITKAATPDEFTIGDTVSWLLTVNVPAGVIAYFPVVEENKLLNGFEYIDGTTVVNNATLADVGDHPSNPLISYSKNNNQMRWFFETVDNSLSATDLQFTIAFDTLVTGVQSGTISKEYYTNNCKRNRPTNTAYVGWYDDSTGFNNSGQAEDDISTSYDFTSAKGTDRVEVAQPCLTLDKSPQYEFVGAGGQLYFDLVIENTGRADAYDVVITDTLPMSVTFLSANEVTISPDPGGIVITDNNTSGDTGLTYGVSRIPAGATLTIRYTVEIDELVSASLDMTNVAKVTAYSTQSGTPPDTNADTLADERTYIGPEASGVIRTDRLSIAKASETPDEFTIGSTVVYTLTFPSPTAHPSGMTAWMYDTVVRDEIDSRLQIESVSEGVFANNIFTATYESIAPGTVKTIVVTASVPVTTTAQDGDVIPNRATLSNAYETASSNITQDQFVAPALVVSKYSDKYTVLQGDTVSYVVEVQNVGQGTAKDLVITDSLPDNQSYLNGATGVWNVATLAGGERISYTFQSLVNSVDTGLRYTNIVYATGDDSEGNPIVADRIANVPGDSDPLDVGQATIYGGPLDCNKTIKNVAFEDLKNTGWSDWDYNDLIVRVDAELCQTPSAESLSQTRAVNACTDIDIEAESGVLTGFTLGSDVLASGGQYIQASGLGEISAADGTETATYTFNVTTPGDYKLSAIVQGADRFSDSFWIKMDDGDPIHWTFDRVDNQWVTGSMINSDTDTTPYTYSLAAGPHTLTVERREGGAKLDKISVVCKSNATEVIPDTLATATITYTIEARGAGFVHALKHQLPTDGSGQALYQLFDPNGNLLESEQTNFGPEPTFTLINDTHVALPAYFNDRPQSNTYEDQPTKVEAQSVKLSFALDDNESNPIDALEPLLPWDLFLPVYDTGEEVHLSIPGHLDNTQAVLGNFDADSPLIGTQLDLAFTFEDEWEWPTEFDGIWNPYPQYADFIKEGANAAWYELDNANTEFLWEYRGQGNGQLAITAGYVTIEEEETSRFFGSPTIADLNGDGSNEIVLGDLLSQEIKVFDTTGSLLWSANIGSGIKASPTVGNIDGDSDLEILFGAEDGYLYAYNHNGNSGSPVSGFPVQINENRILASPLIGDINKDGNNEIFVVASNGRIYARNADGSSMWSASLGDVVDLFGSQEINSEPVIDDLDIDGKNELIIGGYDGRVYVYDEGGNEVWSYKTGDTIVATPVVGNITPEYSGKEVVIGSGDGKLYLLSSDGSRIWERNTNGIIRTAVALADVDSDGYNDIIVGTDQHKLYVYSDWGSEITSWRKSLGGAINGAPVVGDVDYDGENEIVVSSNDSKIYAWDLNGFEVPGWPRTIDISAKDGPVLANLDGDSPLEIVIADFGGNLYIWGADDTLFEIFTPLIESP